VATTKLESYVDDEFEFAGALRGEPVEMTKAKTADLEVPAHAEIILEGEIDFAPEHAKSEGPFGEWMGYYEEPMMLPTFHLKCLTSRKNPFYQVCLLGRDDSEGEEMLHPLVQANSYNYLKKTVLGFRDFWTPIAGRGYQAVVQIRKLAPEWAKQALLAALSSPHATALINWVVVVDEDIDIYSADSVNFAISTRCDPVRDVLILPEIGVYPLNPAASRRDSQYASTAFTEFSFISKMGIDATKKLPTEHRRPTGERVWPDHDAWQKVKTQWKDYGLP